MHQQRESLERPDRYGSLAFHCCSPKNHIPGHKDGSHNRDPEQGSLPAPESFPCNRLAVIGCFAVLSQKMTVVKCPRYGIRMWIDDYREVRHSRRGF